MIARTPDGELSPGPNRTEGADPRLLDYDFALPADQVARYPAARREDARLLSLLAGEVQEARAGDLPSLLRAGDLLVVNDVRVLRARIWLTRESGGSVEALLLGAGPGPVEAMLRPARRLRVGERLALAEPAPGLEGGSIELLERGSDATWRVAVHPSAQAVMDAVGHVPLPPYLGRMDERLDRERYQTVYAGPPGAVAAPTAGLHLSEDTLARLAAAGVELARLTLDVGAGTFRNLRSEDLDAGRLHAERYRIPADTVRRVAGARAAGRRVVAVGTTTARALESSSSTDGVLRAGESRTDLFIREGYAFRVVDVLMTNFHLPKSSLLMLVCAFGGRDRVMAAYARAVRDGFRFFSYGDAMLLDRGGAA